MTEQELARALYDLIPEGISYEIVMEALTRGAASGIVQFADTHNVETMDLFDKFMSDVLIRIMDHEARTTGRRSPDEDFGGSEGTKKPH
jgi:hypothetical protein